MPMSTASTICPWPCPLSCCCQRRIAMLGRNKTLQSSPALPSAAVYALPYFIRNIIERGWTKVDPCFLTIILFPHCSLFSPCLLVAPKTTQTRRRSPLRSLLGPCGRFPLRNCGSEEAPPPPYLCTIPRPPHLSRGPASASLKR